jgi:hypothetical protein
LLTKSPGKREMLGSIVAERHGPVKKHRERQDARHDA